MKILAEVEEIELEGDHGPVPGVLVTCTECEHCVESFGTSERSVNRCLALLREECPQGERNYYTTEED